MNYFRKYRFGNMGFDLTPTVEKFGNIKAILFSHSRDKRST